MTLPIGEGARVWYRLGTVLAWVGDLSMVGLALLTALIVSPVTHRWAAIFLGLGAIALLIALIGVGLRALLRSRLED